MTSQLNYLVVRQRHIEFVCRAEQVRLASHARAAVSAPSRRWNLSRLGLPQQLERNVSAVAASRDEHGRSLNACYDA